MSTLFSIIARDFINKSLAIIPCIHKITVHFKGKKVQVKTRKNKKIKKKPMITFIQHISFEDF